MGQAKTERAKALAYENIKDYLEDYFPDKLKEYKGNVSMVVKKLLTIVHVSRLTEGDAHALRHKDKDTMLPRDQNPGLHRRKAGGAKVGIDDQSEA